MRNGVPTLYWVARWVWCGVHLVVVALAVAAVGVWAVTDRNGLDVLDEALFWVRRVSDTLGSLVTYPWD